MLCVTFMPQGVSVEVEPGTSLLSAQIQAGLHPDAPCGGKGTCGKCRVRLGQQEVLACQTPVIQPMTVWLPEKEATIILTQGLEISARPDGQAPYTAAFDIGTTTLVGFLLDGTTGQELACASTLNPQAQYGADVISRIQTVLESPQTPMRACILQALDTLTRSLARQAGIDPAQITCAALVGNTAMHHLLLGIDPRPLVTPPYMPRQTQSLTLDAKTLLPISGQVRILPNIAGFVGADTVGCLTATRFDRRQALTLMIDIGTNGEMVLGDCRRRVACSTAAGPAFEGAKISQGMRGSPGAIDHVSVQEGGLAYHVIGEQEAKGLCGSGLLDLIACLLELGILDESGYLEGKAYTIPGTAVTLTQADVREVQLAKAAIRAGIELMCSHLQVRPEQIQSVLLAGAFGNYLDPRSACRIGMIPPCLLEKIQPIGNAAGAGAKLCALSQQEFAYSETLAAQTEFLELASKPDFQDRFVDALEFCEEDDP